ncbi:MAG: FkbM family methyltransferase [Leptolinea sp.]|nr:FkbM family methyltransferase [Leptolinea sp.]
MAELAGKLPFCCERKYKQVKLSSMIKFAAFRYYFHSIVSIVRGFYHPYRVLVSLLDISGNSGIHGTVKLKNSGVTFSIRNGMDVWSIKESFLDDFYRLNETSPESLNVILDIGAGIGEFAIQAGSKCPHSRIYGFEPFPESFSMFQKNIDCNGLTNIYPVGAAVSSIPGNLVMDTSSGNPLQYSAQNDSQTGIPVSTIVLLDFIKQHDIETVDLLKMDCEGGEFAILLPLSNQELSRFKRIVMEYHDSITSHHHDELLSHLKNGGFSVEVKPNVVHDDIGYIYAQYIKS